MVVVSPFWGQRVKINVSLSFLAVVERYKVNLRLCLPMPSKEKNSLCPRVTNLGIQAYLRDTAGLVPYHRSKVNVTVKLVTPIFGFPVCIKVIFTLYHNLLSV